MPPSCARARACVSTRFSRRALPRPPRTPREARRNANRFHRFHRFRRKRRFRRRPDVAGPRAASRAQPRAAVAPSPRAARTPNAERASPSRRDDAPDAPFPFGRLPSVPPPVRSCLDETYARLRARRWGSHRRRRSRGVVRRAPASVALRRIRPRGVSAEPPRPAPGAGPACAARGGTRCRAARARRIQPRATFASGPRPCGECVPNGVGVAAEGAGAVPARHAATRDATPRDG